MKNYTTPKLEVIELQVTDVIMASLPKDDGEIEFDINELYS